MPNSNELSGFNTKWKNLYGQAQANHIPTAAVSQVYNLDLSRLRSGTSYQYSKAEAWAMLQSAGQGYPSTPAQPAQPFSVGRVPGYVGTDVKNFGAGLIGLFKKGLTDVIHPTHAAHQVEALWKDPKVLEDPMKGLLSNPLGILTPGSGKQYAETLGQSQLLSALVPGVYDVAEANRPGGLTNLAEHPFTSLLDLAPAGEALGAAGRSLARIGLDEAGQEAVAAAGRFKPGDMSNEARQARAQAQVAVDGTVRRSMAVNPTGTVGLLHRIVMEMPFHDDTFGAFLSARITQSSKGQVGALSSALGRIIQEGRRTEAQGARIIGKELDPWYREHGLDSVKERVDFSYLTTHYRADWRDTMAEGLDPGEADKLENALADYGPMVELEKMNDLAKDNLVEVQDPRTGEYETRGTSGTDAAVATRYRAFLEATIKRNDVARELSDLTGNDVPGTLEGAQFAILNYVQQAVAEPARRFISIDPKNELAVRGAFPTVAREQIDPNDPGALAHLIERAKAPQFRRSDVLRVGKLLGPAGKFAYLAAYLRAGHLADAERLLGTIIPTARSKYAMGNPAMAALVPDLIRARAVIKHWNKSATKAVFTAFDSKQKALEKALDANPEARFAPRMAELVQDRLMGHLNGQEVSEEDLALVGFQVANGVWKGETFAQIVTPKEMTKIVNSAMKTLREERAQGLDPLFVYSVKGKEIGRIGSVQPEERIVASRSSKSRARFNPSAVYDPIIGLKRKALEDLSERVAEEMFYGEHGILARYQVPFDNAVREAMQFVKTPEDPTLLRHAIDDYTSHHYAELDPKSYFPRRAAELTGASVATPILVPREVKTALDANFKAIRPAEGIVGRVYGAGTRLFRTTLLDYSPRYQVHIWGGGAVLDLLRTGPVSMARYMPAAFGMMVQDSEGLLRTLSQPGHPVAPVLEWMKRQAAKQGEHGMDPRISHELAESDPGDLLGMYNYSKGGKLGNWLATIRAKNKGLDAAGYIASGQAGADMASFGANLLRSLAYLQGKAAGGGDRDAGIAFALKVFADMDRMTPLERTIIRYAMPFYGWTSHILKYVATYPLDHPYRAAVLSQMINQEWSDWNTGIPQSMMYLLELGGVGPDGSATVLDVRQLDPLRSVDDVFTMTGFLSSLNPAIQNMVLPALGIDPTTAGPLDLYPTMTIDQFYGTEQAKPRNPLGVAEAGIAGYIPQATAVETVLGLTSYARWAKQNDPQAYRNQIYQAFNYPWVPYKVNLYQVVAKTEERNYNVARDAATAALNDPNPNSSAWKALMAYSYVPYQGWYVAPSALRQWAFDQVIAAGYWNGQQATLAPSALVTPPSAPNI